MRDENVRLTQTKKCFGSFPLQVPDYSLGHVLDIERALAQIGIIDFGQGLGVMRGDFLKNPLDIAKVGLQFPQHFVDQCAILNHEQMSVEDCGIFCSDRFCNALLHLQNLHARLNERCFEPPDFVRDLGRGDAITRHVIQIVPNDMDLAVGSSR